MKKLILIFLSAVLFSSAQAQDDLFEFVSQFGSGSSLIDGVEHIDTDPDGNILIFGTFEEEVDFDFGDGEYLLEPLGFPDLFLAKYQSDGTFLWAHRIGRIALNNGVFANGLVVDAGNNIVIAGGFSNTIDFDPSAAVNSLSSAGGADAFIAKYNTDGEFVWAQRMGSTGSELHTALSIDLENDYYVGLRFSSDTDIDPGENELIVTPEGASDAVLVKLTEDGDYIQSYQIGSAENDEINTIGISSVGEVVVGAYTNGALSGFPNRELYLSVLDLDGLPLWDYSFNNLAVNNEISSISFSQDGASFYISGRIQAPTDFDPSEGNETIVSPLFADVFFAKYTTATAALDWAKHIQGAGVEDYAAASIEAGAAFMIAGTFENSAIFEPGNFDSQVASAGGTDVFLAAYSRETGDFIDVQSFGGAGNEVAIAGAFEEGGLLALAGSFTSSLELDPNGGSVDALGFSDFFFSIFNYDLDLSSEAPVSEEMIKVYPVPSSDVVNFTVPQSFSGSKVNVKLISVVGKVVANYSFETTNFNKAIDISALNSGIYLLEFSMGNQSITKRIIKN